MQHFGFILEQDSAGTWRFVNDSTPLPASDRSGVPPLRVDILRLPTACGRQGWAGVDASVCRRVNLKAF